MKGWSRDTRRQPLRRFRYPAPLKVLFRVLGGLAIVGTLLCGAELVVRAARFAPPPFDVSDAQRLCETAVAELNAQFQTDAFACDPWLLWQLRPGGWLTGHLVAEQGFLAISDVSGRSASPDKVLLVVGDSLPCVAYRTFPEIAAHLLRDCGVERSLRFINAAVPGYSTEQVRRWLSYGPVKRLDVVVVSVGLADSSPSWGVEDAHLGTQSRAAQWMARHFWWLHLVRWLTYGQPNTSPQGSGSLVRVPPACFEENVRDIVERAQHLGAKVVLVTQPVKSAMGERVNSSEEPISVADTPRRWRQLYNDILRRVAFEEGADLIDLDQEVRRRATDVLLATDGVHLSPAGHNLAARLLLRALNRAGMLSQEELQVVARRARYDTTCPDAPRVIWQLSHTLIETTTAAQYLVLGVLAANSGNTIWLSRHTVPRLGLRTHVALGSTALVATWLPNNHTNAADVISVQRFPLPHDVFPGEATSQTLQLRLPQESGDYTLRLGLDVDGLGALSHYGADETSLTVRVR